MKEIQMESTYNVGDKAQITYCMPPTKTSKLRNTLHLVESFANKVLLVPQTLQTITKTIVYAL